MQTWSQHMNYQMNKKEQKQLERLLRKPNRTTKQTAKIRAIAAGLGYDPDEIEYLVQNIKC